MARLPFSRGFIIVAHDSIVITAAFPVAMLLRDHHALAASQVGAATPMMALLLFLSVLLALLTGPHRPLWRDLTATEILQLARYVLVVVFAFYVGHFLVDRLVAVPPSVPFIHFLTAMFGLLSSRLVYGVLRARASAFAARGVAREGVLLIGSGDGASLLVHVLRRARDRTCDVVGILCDEVDRDRRLAGVPVLGGLDDFEATLARLRVQGIELTRLVVTRPHHELGQQALYRLMQRAADLRVEVSQLPDLVDLTEASGMTEGSGEVIADDGARPIYRALKRGFDIAVATVVLIALSPLFAVIAAAVAWGIQRPVIFVQVRPGRGRRPFRLYKFRTMRDPVDARGRALDDAARTPLVGRVLRRVRLDELPQFWNVLIGDMAVIGPRPLLARDLEAMTDRIDVRCAVRPGITGWAQVNGGHQLTAEEKIMLDLWYARHAGPLVDLAIILRTVGMMIRGERRSPEAIDVARVTGSAVEAGAD
ncbi:MAG: sugar transferase [Alphaproteobacteria bacterium]